MLFATFDYIMLIVIFIFNFGVWKYKIIKKRNRILYLIVFLLFGLIVPYFSVDFEIKKAVKDQPFVDGFTLLYVYFRFPIWWFIGIIEVLILTKLIYKTKS
ncbi:hypothetical protein SAMN05443633_10772 [Chryseobacterium arachidis]|uniref:Uncharacterized protein n=2 Tax=Chryseobacterium arachidis TaxID=1416778 RepID=A0A1M5EV57_9FLAO|nr:hypothetical protein SAMN05443633_10772 [Chryseobacterium arachidis]